MQLAPHSCMEIALRILLDWRKVKCVSHMIVKDCVIVGLPALSGGKGKVCIWWAFQF